MRSIADGRSLKDVLGASRDADEGRCGLRHNRQSIQHLWPPQPDAPTRDSSEASPPVRRTFEPDEPRSGDQVALEVKDEEKSAHVAISAAANDPHQRSHRSPHSAPLRRAAEGDAATFHAGERAGREAAEAQLQEANELNRTLNEQIAVLRRQVEEQTLRPMSTAGGANAVGSVAIGRLARAPPAPEPSALVQVARADLGDALLVEAGTKAAEAAEEAAGALLAKTPVAKLHEGGGLGGDTSGGGGEGRGGGASSEVSDKSMMKKMCEFHLCGIKAFYDGLEEAVGMPNPDLFESMRREHTKRSDSDIWFTTSNYSCHTSSCIEWYFVVEPARGKEVLKRKSYPSEAAGLERRKRRNERELDTFDVAISDVNHRLRQHAQRPLRKEEFIASRLYTGPMFQKYNAVLRANVGDAEKTPQWMKDNYQQLCKGNRYTTTIWVLNSAIVKLKVLTPAACVYRGLKGLALPYAFRTKNEHGIKGGVEPGFMSTTLDYKVAMTYAGAYEKTKDKDASGIVFEIHQGLVDRGCDLSWLSQYPFEREILFAPLTGVEVLDTRVDGSVLVVVLRPTTNQKAATIDQVVSRLQNSHVQFVDLLMEQFTRADSPSEALKPLKTLKSSALKREPKWFNEAENYREATDKALSAKEEVFNQLKKSAEEEVSTLVSTLVSTVVPSMKTSTASPTAGEQPRAVAVANSTAFGGTENLRDKAAKYFNVAKLCAASKKINLAIVLLHLSLQLCNEEKGSRLHPMLTTDDYEAIEYIYKAEDESTYHAEGGSTPATVTRSKSESRPPSTRSQAPRALSKTVSAVDLRGGDENNISDVLKVSPCDRLILLKMLLKEPNEIGAWAPTIVGLLTPNAEQAERVLRCFVQFLESHKLIEDKPIKIGSTLLALADGEHKDDIDYQRGVLLANIQLPDKDPKKDSQSGARHDVRHGDAKVVHLVKLPNGTTIKTTLVLPFGNNDAGAVLRAAAAQNNVAVLTALLDKGLSPLHADEHANTALHEAAENGCEKACTTLLTHPAMQPLAHLQPAFMSNIHGVRPYDWSLMGKRASPRLRTVIKQSVADKLIDKLSADSTPKPKLLQWILDQGHGESGLPEQVVTYVDVNEKGKFGITPLMLAAFRGFSKTVQCLLEKHADPLPKTDEGGCTALTMAVLEGHKDVVEKLLYVQNNLEMVQHTEEDGSSALLRACQNGHHDVALLLIEKKSEVNIQRTDTKRTPLIMAARAGSKRCVETLLKNKADPFMTDAEGNNALTQAAYFGHAEVVEVLAKLKADGADGSSAAEVGETPVCPTINRKENAEEQTALVLAARRGHLQTVQALLRRGADVHLPDKNGLTALMWACNRGHDAIIPLLIASGERNERDGMPQRLATDDQRLATDKEGMTALMHAAHNGHVQAAEILVVEGWDLLDRNNHGMTALMLAARSGVKEMVHLLSTCETLGGHQNQTRWAERPADHAQIAPPQHAAKKRLIVKKEVLNEIDSTGKTALMYAAECLHASTIRELLHAGCDRTKTDQNGLTAHMMARSAKSTSREVKIGALREFHGQFGDCKEGNPPLCALRGKDEVKLNADDLVGVGAFVLDVGTGACKIMIWVRFDTVSLIEAKEAEIKKLPSGTELNFEKIFKGGKGEEDPVFKELVTTLHKAMETAFEKHKQLHHCLFTNVCIGLTAWYRQLSEELQKKGRPVMDALRDKLQAKALELSHSRSIESKWFVVSQKEEAMWEHKSVEYALQAAGLEPPLALLSGGQGSVQLSGLDGFTSYDLQLKEKIKSIDKDVEKDPEKDPGKRKAGLDAWREEIKRVVNSKTDKLASQLNEFALESQGESSEPVRIVLISGLFYVAVAAKIVQANTDHYAYQPASVVLEMFDQLLEKVNDANTKTQDLVGAVRVSELLRSLIDGAYVQRVELLFARDWVLHGVGKLHDGTLMFPEGQAFNFRTTWTAGWWLDQLAELYRLDTVLDFHEAGIE